MTKKRKFPVFYTIYFSLLALFFVFLVIFAHRLSDFIKEYNEGIPETVSERFFESTFKNNPDVKKIIEMSGISAGEYETNEHLEAYVKEKLSGNLSYTSISSGSDENKKNYIVKSGDSKIASFTLIPDKKGDYNSDTLALHVRRDESVTCKVFEGTTLYINGIKADDGCIVETAPFKHNELLTEQAHKPVWNTYVISDLLMKPDIYAVDRNGLEVVFEEIDGVLCEKLVYDTPEEELCTYLMTAAKDYAKCMQNDLGKTYVYPYFEKGTELYDSIRTVETGFAWDHNSYSFENESYSEFMRYDDNTVSLRISFTHVLKLYGRADYRDYIDITFFARDIDGVYKIFNRINN